MNLMIKDFPDEVLFKCKLKAFEGGVTLRQFVIDTLGEYVGISGRGTPEVDLAVREKHLSRLNRQRPAVFPPPPPEPGPPPADGERMTLGEELEEEWEPEVPQVSHPWDGSRGKKS